MAEESGTPGAPPSVRELLGLPPDADEATVAAARARLLSLLDAGDVTDGGGSAVVEEIADADGYVDPLAELGEADEPVRVPRTARAPRPPRAARDRAASGAASAPRPGSRAAARRSARQWAPALTVAVVLGIVFAFQQIGGGGTVPVPPPETPAAAQPSAPGPVSPAPPVVRVDEDAVAAQEELLAQDPENAEVLRELADLYFDGNDFAGAEEWGERLVEVAPEDAEAHLMLGVARFNQVDLEGAQEAWERVVDLDPENATAYYNLGFLYWSLQPPDLEAAQTAWEKVLEIAPDSDMAANVGPHLNALQNRDS